MARHMGPNRGVPEQSRDFKGSIKRLFNSLNTWKYFLFISLILAMISAILALVAPNKLSSLTDTITIGIRPNINEKVIQDIMTDTSISDEDKMKFKTLLDNAQDKSTDVNKIYSDFDKLPKSIKKIVKPKIDMAKVKSIALFLGILYSSFIQSLKSSYSSNSSL